MKQNSFVARDKSSLNYIFDKTSALFVFLKGVLVQKSIVSSKETLVKRGSTSRIPIKDSESYSIISSAKANVFFAVYWLLVKDFKIDTRNFTNLYVGVLIADKIDQKCGKLSMISLWTLQNPHITPGLVRTGLRDLLFSSDILLNATSFLKILSTRFLGWQQNSKFIIL